MLGLAKISGEAGISYTLDLVAKDAHDYRTGGGEAQGRWLGRVAETLELTGEVTEEAVRRAYAGQDPRNGEQLLGNRSLAQRKVLGIDHTFSAPKSVAMLWALTTDDHVRRMIVEAHETAIADTLDYLERRVLRTRTRAGGSEKLRANGVLAASYRHRTSRAGDPDLHSHVIVFNMTQGEDGRWRTIDTPPLWGQSKTLGMLYQARLRAEITDRLGLSWGEVTRHGQADLEGFEPEQIVHFSKRRAEIVEHAINDWGRGLTGKAMQASAYATRDRKVKEGPGLLERWRSESDEHGISPNVDRLTADAHPGSWVEAFPSQEELDREITDPLTGITANTTVFARHDLLRYLATRVRAGASVDALEALADHILSNSTGLVPLGKAEDTTLHTDDVIRLRSGKLVKHSNDTERFTTEELFRTEIDATARARYRVEAERDVARVLDVDVAHVERERTTLGDDQRRVMRGILQSGRPIDIVTGPPGTGKTYTLDAVRQGFERAGYKVYGACLAAAAAENLQTETRISAATVANMIGRLADGHRLPAGSVLVIDEAAMIGTRELALLLDAAQVSRAKVILVGDDRQLPSIQAGGLYRTLARDLGTLELTNNRRQRNEGEREAVELLRAGKIDKAYRKYQNLGLVQKFETTEDLHAGAVGSYLRAREGEPDARIPEIAIYTSTWFEAQAISDTVREQLRQRGNLGDDQIEIRSERTGATLAFAIGDEVLLKRNDYHRLNVKNSNLAKVRAINSQQRTMTVEMATGTRTGELVTIDRAYLDGGHVEHAYARVVAANQGQTINRGLFLATAKTSAEEGLVALSRGRESNSLYLLDDTETDVLEAMQCQSTEALAAEHLTDQVRAQAEDRLRAFIEEHAPSLAPHELSERARILRPPLAGDVGEDLDPRLAKLRRQAAALQRQAHDGSEHEAHRHTEGF